MSRRNNMMITVALLFMSVLICAGCAETRNVVFAATETTIGVNISQNPATSSPQAKLGYNRAEIALVPSKRNMESSSKDSLGNGPADVPDVLMELRYSGIFDWGSGSGIYQRLAVGKSAVSQPGAAMMFAKDNAGAVSADAQKLATALKNVQAIPVIPEETLKEKAKLGNSYRAIKESTTLSADEKDAKVEVFSKAARAAGYEVTNEEHKKGVDEFMKFLTDVRTDSEKVLSIKRLIQNGGITIP